MQAAAALLLLLVWQVTLEHSKKIWYWGCLISQRGEECNYSALKAGQEWIQNSSSGSSWGLATVEAEPAGKVRKKLTWQYKMDFKLELYIGILSLHVPGSHADVNDIATNSVHCISETMRFASVRKDSSAPTNSVFQRWERRDCLFLFCVAGSLGASSLQCISSFGLLSTCFGWVPLQREQESSSTALVSSKRY